MKVLPSKTFFFPVLPWLLVALVTDVESCSESELHEDVVNKFEELFIERNCYTNSIVSSDVNCFNGTLTCNRGLFRCDSYKDSVYYASVDYQFLTNDILNKTTPESVFLHYSFPPTPSINVSQEETYNFANGEYFYKKFFTDLATNTSVPENEIRADSQCIDKLSLLVRIGDEVAFYSSNAPSSSPSSAPSRNPSSSPSSVPSRTPSSSPSSVPSRTPSFFPSSAPSRTYNPSSFPSSAPSGTPSSSPSSAPSGTYDPSSFPSSALSGTPSSSPSSAPSGTYDPSSFPSSAPSRTYKCTTTLGEERDGLLFEFEIQASSSSGGNFTTRVNNQLSNDNGADFEYVLETSRLERFEVCLTTQECWNVRHDGIVGDGYFKGYLAGEEIFVSQPNSADTINFEFCIGERKHCYDLKRGFKYRTGKRGKKKKKTKCEKIQGFNTRKQKRICNAKFGGEGKRRVKKECLETCGKVGKGDCQFLKTYGD